MFLLSSVLESTRSFFDLSLALFDAGVPTRAATGTSLAAISLTAAAGTVAYALHGDVKFGAAALLGIPGVLGVIGGVALQQRVTGRTLTLGFALVLTAVGIRLLV